MATSFVQRTKELKAANPSLTAMEAARQARIESSPTYATNQAQKQINSITRQWSNNIMWSIDALGWDLWAVESWNPDAPLSGVVTAGTWASTAGELKAWVSSGAITTNTVQWNTNKINAATPTIAPSTTNTQGNVSTVTGWGYGTWGTSTVTNANKNWQIEGKTNQVLWDVINNYDTNKATDTTQLQNNKLAVEANAMEVDTELKRKQLEDIELAKEEDRIQKQKAADDANNLSALQEKERARNEASIAMAEAKSEAAERELAIANDVELQKSNVAFAKLWLTLSTAAVTSAQQIYTTWVYNLSKLKSENAYANANLRVEVAKVEFDHTTAVNKIINDSSTKSYTIRKTLNDDINKINNSIIDNRLSRVEKLNAVMDKYQKEVETNEENTLKLIKGAATTLDDITKSMYDTLKTKEGYGQDKINTIATNGKWFVMTPAEKIKYEQTAWLPKGTVVAQIKASIGKGVVSKLEGIANLSAGKINWVIDEAMKLMETWAYGMEAAIAVALTNSPEYQTQLKLAQAKKNKVGGSGGWGKATSAYGTSNLVSYVNAKWETNQANYIPWKWGTSWYLESDWVRIPMTGISKISPVNPNNLNNDEEI